MASSLTESLRRTPPGLHGREEFWGLAWEALEWLETNVRAGTRTLETGAGAYACANPGCLVQVTQALRRARRPLPALHPIELVDASIRGESAARLRVEARR